MRAAGLALLLALATHARAEAPSPGAPLQLPVLAEPRKALTPVKLRFYADDDYRAGNFRWADEVKARLEPLNRLVEPTFGIRFEAESFRRWHRPTGGDELAFVLAALETMDPGADVDWVLALIGPPGRPSADMDELGTARVLGRHFVLRAVAHDAREESALFLHQWLRTLGVLHSKDPQRITHAGYSAATSNVDPLDARLAAVALRARLEGRATGKVSWAALRARLEGSRSPEWSSDERDQVLALLRNQASAIQPRSGEADRAVFKQAVALLREGKGDEAWALAWPAGQRQPNDLEVQRLLCRLGYVKAAGDEGLAACARARALAPERPDSLIDAAQARALRNEPTQALAAIDTAAAQAGRLTAARPDLWLRIAETYGQLGALTRADEALARAGASAGADATRTALVRQRRLLGLPRAPATGSLPPEREPAYAEQHRKAALLVEAGKLAPARAAVVAARKQFPDVPGLEVLSCEIDLRQGRPRPGENACRHALSLMPDLPRAHYLIGHLHMETHATQPAIDEMKRSIDLDPRDTGPWQALADLYRATRQHRDLAALRQAYENQFSRPLP